VVLRRRRDPRGRELEAGERVGGGDRQQAGHRLPAHPTEERAAKCPFENGHQPEEHSATRGQAAADPQPQGERGEGDGGRRDARGRDQDRAQAREIAEHVHAAEEVADHEVGQERGRHEA